MRKGRGGRKKEGELPTEGHKFKGETRPLTRKVRKYLGRSGRESLNTLMNNEEKQGE